ncbi:HNH endonuclease [Vibrio sp. OY15]|uniref:HNH endonuclease n=1 Tax=Vibrio sp. OY15 TaxID=1440054 RepID=UPI0006ACC409|nr:HNH endonuclease [Vibrio sp. OY15]
MIWVVYLGKSAAKNFEIGLRNKVWGHKTIFSTVNTNKIKRGDTLYFVHYLTQMKDEKGKAVPGFPRVDAKYYYGSIAMLVKVRITKDFYQDTAKVWPDDLYPNRYEFEILEHHDKLPFGIEYFSFDFIKAVRESAVTKGHAFDVGLKDDQIYAPNDVVDLERFEGAPVYRRHVIRERDPEVVREKKQQVKRATGRLVCEVCEFDFEVIYGERGADYIECHHKNPLSESNGQKTKLKDLALLCSNCHRMVHRSKPWIKVEKLKEIINERTRTATKETSSVC